MGQRGPAAKPTELKVLEGNRGKRPLALNLDSTFRPEAGMPSVPKDLSPGARKVWKRLGAELLRYNLISVVYSDLFEELCETISDVKDLRHSFRGKQKLLRASGKDASDAFTVLTPNGMPQQHPLYQILKSERQMMLSLMAKFGLSPAEQANVQTAVRAQLQLFEGEGGDKPKDTKPTAASGAPKGFADFD
ncbi:MAG: P27 family phage terminase small subunit [Acidovorax sp.]|uniref:P27 family phage terminase small subunit n=1 Tax=Acidovorax sp. TaxID=1872122 RepID=UPI002615B438|nr:P27 family phage terminase small subunit [Acidovorax sp.]MDH4425080.1 P27 family phage terminase small subunit [Acidovorax sp.]